MSVSPQAPTRNSVGRTRRHAVLYIALVALPIGLLLADAVLILWKVRLAYFISVPAWQYLTIIWTAIAGVIAFAEGIGPATRIGKALITGREGRPPVSVDRVVLVFSKAVARLLRRPVASATAMVIFILVGIVVLSIPILPKLMPSSSGVLATTLGADKLVYIADSAHSRLAVFRSDNLREPANSIPIGARGNAETSGTPEGLIELRRDDLRGHLHLIFVADTANSKIHIIDVNNVNSGTYNTEIPPGLSVGGAPRSMAITPDGRKLFVSHEQPIVSAGIMVFDISSNDPNDFHFITKIPAVNCPEGVVLSPYGDWLYAASQCGGDKDPVFIVDTAANAVVGAVPGMAVGTSVAVNKDGSRLYVGRGNYPCVVPKTKERGSPMTVIDPRTRQIKNTICLQTSVGAMAVSRDQDVRYLFVANGSRLSVFDTRTLDFAQEALNDIQLEATVAGIGVADDNSVYAFMPQSRRLFLYSPAGLTSD